MAIRMNRRSIITADLAQAMTICHCKLTLMPSWEHMPISDWIAARFEDCDYSRPTFKALPEFKVCRVDTVYMNLYQLLHGSILWKQLSNCTQHIFWLDQKTRPLCLIAYSIVVPAATFLRDQPMVPSNTEFSSFAAFKRFISNVDFAYCL